MKNNELRARFWAKVHVRNRVHCWEWTGATQRGGYGSIGVEGKTTGAHRLSYEINIGPIPEGKHVMHKCDNPSCVNPNHLFVGTHTDNMKDKAQKGRVVSSKGENNGQSKLTQSDIRQIRKRLANGESGVSIGKEFGVGKSTISHIKLGRNWGWLK